MNNPLQLHWLSENLKTPLTYVLYVIGPISLGRHFPLASQQGISAESVVEPHPSTNEAPVSQTTSGVFGRLGMTLLKTRCCDVISGGSSRSKYNSRPMLPKPNDGISKTDPPQQ